MKNKYIYEFSLNKKEKKQVETTRKNKDGEEETVLSNRTVKTPIKFVVAKPTRRIADDAEVYYSVKMSESIKKGIVTKAMLIKKYADNGGALTENESKELLKNLKRIHDLENEYQMISATNKKEDQKKLIDMETEISTLRRDLINLESSLQSVYQHTADARAERDTLLWYTIALAKIETEDGLAEYFDGDDIEEQIEDFYEKYEAEEGFDFEAVTTLSRVVGYWFYNQQATQEDINKFLEADV